MIFVTGGTGLIGSHLLYRLTSEGKQVKALKRETSDIQQVLKVFSYYSENPENLFQNVEWVDGDILDYFELEKQLSGIKEIFHCAAIVSFQPKKRKSMIMSNVDGTANLVNAALENGVKKICHVSSVAALGRLPNGNLNNEEINWVPSKKVSGYSESKFFSEAEIWRGIEEGLDAVIINPSIVLGPGKWDSGSPKLFKTVWEGMKFYTKGITGFVDVKDVANAMILLMDETNFETNKNQRFLLNAENRSYQELFNQIADNLNKSRPKYYASNLRLNMAWAASTLYAGLTGTLSKITRDIVKSANSINKFDGSKITLSIDFKYAPLSKTIQQTAELLKKDFS